CTRCEGWQMYSQTSVRIDNQVIPGPSKGSDAMGYRHRPGHPITEDQDAEACEGVQNNEGATGNGGGV
ncbi:MAG: hypothetical protein QGH33_13150, partial [Pirellulaceae bacterium]|nr:hypothetical protein [Pirellulaceae bacterium]